MNIIFSVQIKRHAWGINTPLCKFQRQRPLASAIALDALYKNSHSEGSESRKVPAFHGSAIGQHCHRRQGVGGAGLQGVQVDIADTVGGSDDVKREGRAAVKGQVDDVLDGYNAIRWDDSGIRSGGSDVHGVGEERLRGVCGLGIAACRPSSDATAAACKRGNCPG
jgi:hypothetical protein